MNDAAEGWATIWPLLNLVVVAQSIVAQRCLVLAPHPAPASLGAMALAIVVPTFASGKNIARSMYEDKTRLLIKTECW